MPRNLRRATLGLLALGATFASAPARAEAPASLHQKVDALFAPWARPDSPGAALAVIQDGRIVYEKGYGMADLERAVPLTPTSVFDIGSTSKQFTAMCVLLLAQEGKLSLDDEVQKYVPELPRYAAPITLRQLLLHTSGVRDYLALMALAGLPTENDYSEAQVLELLARQRELNFTPGAEHLYSNSGYFLLSVVVKRASGTSLRQFAEEHLFGPLGMTRTHFHDDFREIVKDRALAYAPRGEARYALDLSLFDVVGDGCLFTTVGDLARWDQNFYASRLEGGQAVVDQLQRPGTLADGTSLSYAFGLSVGSWRGLPTVEHGGAWAGYRAQLLRFPRQHFSVIVLANRADARPTTLARQVAELYLGALLAPEEPTKLEPKVEAPTPPARPVAVSAELLASYAGQYELAPGFLLTVTAEAERLYAQATGQDRFELFAETEELFLPRAFEARIRFVRAPGRKVVEELVLEQGGRSTPAKRRELHVLDAAAIDELRGSYRSDELATTWRISSNDGALLLTNGSSLEAMPLLRSGRDRFAAGGRTFVVERDARKKISAFRVDAGRVRNLRFVKERPRVDPPPAPGPR